MRTIKFKGTEEQINNLLLAMASSDNEMPELQNNLDDRFFLEEIVKRIKDNQDEYYFVLTRDWLWEMVRENPLTEEQRLERLKNSGWDDDFIESAYFGSEKELEEYLSGEEEEEESHDQNSFSITDESEEKA